MFTEIIIIIIYIIYNVFRYTLEYYSPQTRYLCITLTRITLFLYYCYLNTHKISYALYHFYTLICIITPKLLFMQITKFSTPITHIIESLFYYFPLSHTYYCFLCFTPNFLQTNVNNMRLIRLSSLLCSTDIWFNNTLFHNDV